MKRRAPISVAKMDAYQHPLFFEARDLSEKEMKKIRGYFEKKKDSGGGDCRKIEKVKDNLYKVNFKKQQAQERVLLRKTHTISLPEGDIQLTVTETSSPQAQDLSSISESLTFDNPNTNCLEKIFKTDAFFLFYLRDNPKAFEDLQKHLSALDCTLELDLEEEEAVLRCKTEEMSVEDFEILKKSWELQVDQIFDDVIDKYTCYHVLDPQQIIKVLQDPLFESNDITVYTESGYPVVVGETEAVTNKIDILKKSLQIQQELPVVENKFKLVEDEFRREMSTHYPDVKVSRGTTNSIILEGSDECVQSGAAKLDELMKKIKQKKVQLSSDLLTFMKSSDFASKYETRFQQSLKSPVSMEVGADLLLSSLSPDSLHEAETAVLRDLSVVSIQLHGAAAVNPHLTRVKEMLNKAKNEESSGESRVDVSFISSSSGPSTTTVQLVGYTEQVNKLKDILHDYQMLAKQNTSLEKIFETDLSLLFYLRDIPKAFQDLQKQLSAVDCTLELDFDKEVVVVKNSVVWAFSSAAEKWELQVDQIFNDLKDKYTCYHVLDPKQIITVLQDSSFVSNDIKVYTESGYPVVVGETGAVTNKIDILKKSLQIQKELQVVENKFKLVEDEFQQEISTHYPDAKVSRGTTNSIILEGSDECVQSGAAKLDELMKKIKEKKVQLSSDLLTFMKSSDFASKYETQFQQSLRSPVSMEVGSDLLLSSLSPDSLHEAETAVLRDLSVVSIQLHGAAAVNPHLTRVKEIIQKAKNEANHREFRVDVSFNSSSSGTPTTTVQLVGYTEHVNKLKDLLHDYQANQVSTQEVLNLQFPEMVNRFDHILKMIGMKQTNVTMKAFHFPSPRVLLSGPLRLVKDTQQDLTSALVSVTLDTLVLDGPGALRYFQGDGKVSKELVESSCQVLIWDQQGERSKINLKIKICTLQDEKVDVLVAPMLYKQLASTNIGTCLLIKAGNTVQSNFNSKAACCTLAPGDVLEVDASSSLGCSKIFFIESMAWDGVTGKSVQALGKGLRRCLDLCVQQGFSSVAIPVIGPGFALKFPLTEAVQVLTETICEFGMSSGSGSLTTIHIVIKPGYPDCECYHEVYYCFCDNINRMGRAFFESFTTDLEDVDMALGGGTKLQVIFGDITNETTDAVVNTTDFTNFYGEGVCKDILSKAGKEVEAELKAAKVNQGGILKSKPGLFPCKALLHVHGEKDAGAVEQLICDIIKCCEQNGFKSLAIPALHAGTDGLDPVAIQNGIKVATSSTHVYSLTNVRLVLNKIDVFLTCKKEAMQMFPLFSQVPVPQSPVPSLLKTNIAGQQSAFHFLGLSRKDVDDAMEKFKNLYETQCSNHTFNKEDFSDLTQEALLELQQLVETEGLCSQLDSSGNLTVRGLKDGVSKMVVLMHDLLKRIKEENYLYTRVSWCIMGQNGNWERLPKTANYNLEKQDLRGGIKDAQGVLWQVDLKDIKATSHDCGQRLLKRLEHRNDFTFPLYWDSMAADEVMKVVTLQPSAPEYQAVERGFKQTVHKNITKIERLQNIHLYRAYEAQKKQLSDKNKHRGGAGEKLLYHGTTQDNSDSIMKTGFNRRFAGQNATVYGEGTYFAVNASYSANPTYSKPAADGSQLMFVVKVLTGKFTQGKSGMKVPPPLDNQHPHDRYDSVVDNTNSPSMFIVFHDDQAYLDYLITFK